MSKGEKSTPEVAEANTAPEAAPARTDESRLAAHGVDSRVGHPDPTHHTHGQALSATDAAALKQARRIAFAPEGHGADAAANADRINRVIRLLRMLALADE